MEGILNKFLESYEYLKKVYEYYFLVLTYPTTIEEQYFRLFKALEYYLYWKYKKGRFEDKFENLLNELDFLKEYLFPFDTNVKKLAINLNDTRNYIAHPQSKPKGFYTPEDLIKVTQKLLGILEMVLLQELSIEKDSLKNILKNNIRRYIKDSKELEYFYKELFHEKK